MMKFSPQLYHTYQLIRNCALVKHRQYTPTAIYEFETLLNSCQPDMESSERFDTVKEFYNTAKYNFQRFIHGSALECTILWTESKAIVNWFALRGIVYLNYANNRYHAQLHRNMVAGADLQLSEFPTCDMKL